MANKATIRQARYDEKNTRIVKMKLNLKKDRDILEKLDSEPNKQGYIKKVIREDIKKSSIE